jgi:hypothetical protein
MQLGCAAGIASVLALGGGSAVQDVSLAALQNAIVEQGGIIQPSPCTNPSL